MITLTAQDISILIETLEFVDNNGYLTDEEDGLLKRLQKTLEGI